MDPIEPFLAILFLAFLAEGLTEYLARPILDGLGSPDPGNATASGHAIQNPKSAIQNPLWLRYVACLVGVGLALAFRADLFSAVGLAAINPWIAYVLTGILIGRGSNYVHDLIDTWRSPGPAA